jgi:predicted Zn-dependent peptidase
MQLRRAGAAALLTAVLTLSAQPAAAQRGAEPLPDNPFAIFESFRLANGLKVWYGHLPGSSLTSMAVIVPTGWDADAPGREQTAHFLEHVLLSDRHGRLEADLVRELTARGGSHNGVTTPDRTYFPLSVGTDHAAFGLHWLAGVLAPRAIDDRLVERNREPVAIEIDARPRPLLERLAVWYARFPPLRPPSFWKREFGLATSHDRIVDEYRALSAITASDLQTFFDTHYSPADMTFVIVTGAPRAELQAVLDTTVGMLPWRPSAERAVAAVPRHGESRRHSYWASRSTTLRIHYRLPPFDAHDHLRLVFIEDLLRHRLMERLRRGQDKLIYGVQAFTDMRGPAAYFGISARIDPRFESTARAIIEEEIERVRHAAADTAAFYADRDALGRRIRVQNAAPASLVSWATNRFYRPDVYQEFPDVGSYYAEVGPDSIAAFAQRIFSPDMLFASLWRPPPIPLEGVVVLLTAAAFTAVRLYRRLALRRVDMNRIRFVARLRPPLTARALRAFAFTVLALAVGRVAFAAIELAAERWVLSVDSVPFHGLMLATVIMAGTLAVFAAVGLVPVKVMVFDDEVLLKSRTFHSRAIPASRIAGMARPLSRRGLRLRQFWPAPVGDAVLLQLTDGSGYLLRTADPVALQLALQGLLTRSGRTCGDPGDNAAAHTAINPPAATGDRIGAGAARPPVDTFPANP